MSGVMEPDDKSDVDRLVEAAPITLDDDLVRRLIYDIAQRIHPADEIAQRYGLGDEAGLRDYLQRHPKVVEETRRLRAYVESDKSAEERTRLKATFATEHLIADVAGIAGNPTVPIGQRLDAFKQISRVAGVDGIPAAVKSGAGGDGGNQFIFTVNFSGGRTETITTVVDAEPLALPGGDE